MAEQDPNPNDPLQAEEVQAEAELRLGGTRGKNTIVEVVRTDVSENSSSLLTFGRPPRRLFHPQTHQFPQDPTLLDHIILAVRSIIERIFYSTGQAASDNILLDGDEIDKLAVFQGDKVETYVREWASYEINNDIQKRKTKLYKTLLENDNHLEWERRCKQLLGPAALQSYLLREKESYRTKLRGFLGSWSQEKECCSPNIFLLDDQLTAHRIPSVNQTDGIQGKLGVEEGIHAWDLQILGPVGSHCSIGIASRESRTRLWTNVGYVSLVGDDKNSWGWDIVWGNLSNGGKIMGSYPENIVYDYSPGDSIRLILDCDEGVLSYAVNEQFFGIAFANLPQQMKLYPAVGLVYGNIEVSLVYLGKPPPLRNSRCKK